MSVYVSGQRIPCKRCALRFNVLRHDVATVVPIAIQSTPGVEPKLATAPAPPGWPGEISLEPTLAAGQKRPPPPLPAPPPKQLPGFELVDLLGRGGMGEVWKARQLSLGRDVAIKILSRDLAQDRDFVRRFDLEATAMTNLSHPHVVAIIDRGHHQGLIFFAMELIEGKSLRERLLGGPLPVADVARLMGEILSALGHAHDKGIVHRDLKPENVLLDGRGAAKVADFGLAAMAGRTGADRITRSEVAMGTMSYMAPEQRRDAHGVDQRADLYSAGVVLYELLTGDVPSGHFEMPSRRRTGVPRGVDAVVARALASEPGERYQSAPEMAAAVAQGLAVASGLRGALARWFGSRS